MFKIGDKVVYPMHGAGVIESVEKKEVLGEKKSYFVMKLPVGDMKVMVPIEGMDSLGLRPVIGDEDFEKVIKILQGEKTKMSGNWNRRYRANLEKLRTGDVFEVSEVVRNLALRDREKGLSTGERKMLDNAKQILYSELTLAKGIAEEEIEDMLQSSISVE